MHATFIEGLLDGMLEDVHLWHAFTLHSIFEIYSEQNLFVYTI